MSDDAALTKATGQDKQDARLLRWVEGQIHRGATVFEVLHRTELGSSKVGDVLATEHLTKKNVPDPQAVTNAVLELAEEDAEHSTRVATYIIRTRRGHETSAAARFFITLHGKETDDTVETEAPTGPGYLAQTLRHREVEHKTNAIMQMGMVKAISTAYETTVDTLQEENRSLREENQKLREHFASRELEMVKVAENLLSKKSERELGMRRLLLEEKRNDFLTGKLDGMLDIVQAKFFGHVSGDKRTQIALLIGGLMKRLSPEKLEHIFGVFGDDPEAQAMLFEAMKTLEEVRVKKEDAKEEDRKARVQEKVSGS
jgi:hypothetical protein